MQLTYVYPGSFCPPTYGHYQSILKAASLFDSLYIVCSNNPNKIDKWFTAEECAELWRTAYDLPDNVTVITITEIKKLGLEMSNLVLVRGIRDETHFDEERSVVFLNYKELGIDKFFYLVSNDDCRNISSSKVRNLAADLELEKLSEYVSPLVISALLERVLKAKSISMVVGQPGSGKSTFFKMLHGINPQHVHINTDEINEELKPLLRHKFGDKNLHKVALYERSALKELVAKPWLNSLRERLRSVPVDSHVYIEIPYGLQPDKNMFRFVGGKVIYYQVGDGSHEQSTCQKRLAERGTPELIPFLNVIPDWDKSQSLASEQGLSLSCICAPEDLNDLKQCVESFNQTTK